MFEEKPVRMAASPFGVAVGILLEHHTELHAGLLVAMLAKVSETDHLRLAPVLRPRWKASANNR